MVDLAENKEKSDIMILVTELKEHFKRLAGTEHTNEHLEISVNIHANAPLNKEVNEAEVLKCINELRIIKLVVLITLLMSISKAQKR